LNDVTSQERLGARVKTNLDYYSGNYLALTAFVLMVRSVRFAAERTFPIDADVRH
jgi:hypothetical protein